MMNSQKVTEIQSFLTKNPGYLKRGAENLAAKLDATVEEVRQARSNLRLKFKTFDDLAKPITNVLMGEERTRVFEPFNTNSSENKINEFNTYLQAQGLTQDDVKSVKYWQTQGGDTRFSVVTKNEDLGLPSIEDIRKSLTNIVSVHLPKVEKIKDKTLVVYTSDKHVGAFTKPEAMYSNDYNAEEFFDRMEQIYQEIFNYVNEYGNVKHIVVMDLGDGLDGLNGFTTRRGHGLPQKMSSKEAFDTFIHGHKQFYESLFTSGFAQEYSVVHLSADNHSGQFGYFANRCLQEFLMQKYPQIIFDIQETFIGWYKIEGHNFLLCHGKDEEDLKNGLPLQLDAKTEKYIMDYIVHYGIPTTNLHFIKGDLHQYNVQEGKHFTYKNIPSVYGSSKWIMTNFGYNKPGCSFEVLEGDTSKEWNLWFK